MAWDKEDQQRQDDVLDEVRVERWRQEKRWGEQNSSPIEWLAVLGEEFGEACQAALQAHFGGQTLDSYREELTQVAAVAVAALECLARRQKSE